MIRAVLLSLFGALLIGAVHAQVGQIPNWPPNTFVASGGVNNTAIDGTPVVINCSGCSTTETLSGVSNTTAGDLIGVACLENGTHVTGVTADSGTTFTKRKDQQTAGGVCTGTNDCISFFTGTAAGALTGDFIHVTTAAGSGFMTCAAFSIKGQAGFDANVSLPAVSTSSTLSISTSNANDMLLGFYRMSSTATPTVGAGWTAIAAANFLLAEYKTVTATQSGLSVPIGGGAVDENGGIGDAVKSN